MPDNCPDQYVIAEPLETGVVYSCQYSGVVSVWVSGKPWSRVWWSMAGETATEYSAEARSRLGNDIDPRFDDDREAWISAQAAAAEAAATASPAAGTSGDGS